MRPTMLLATFLIPAAGLAAEPSRTLTFEAPAAEIRAIAVEAGVGEVEIRASDTDSVRVEVEVSAKRSGWFGSRGRGLDGLELVGEVKGGTLYLSVEGPRRGRDRDFGEEWSVDLPRELAVRLELGVGDVHVLDMAGGVDVEVGVGNVRVEGPNAAYGRIAGECGVGDVEIRTPEGRSHAEGFVGRSATASGAGTHKLAVEVGVGDVIVRLR